jgi:uncharacterized protein (DUF1330 family)
LQPALPPVQYRGARGQRAAHQTDGRGKPMKLRYAIVLMLAGGVMGAAAVQGIHAQTKLPVYFVYENTLTNKEAYIKEYLPEALATIKAHGGRVLAAGKTTSFSGEPPKESTGILVWDSMEQLEGWLGSPEYKKIRAVGEQYATYRNFAVPGYAQ